MSDMERLTDCKRKCALIQCGEDCGGDCLECEYLDVALAKLKHYEDLAEQGRLIELPCPIGTEVYDIKWWDEYTKPVIINGETYYKKVYKHKVTKSEFDYCDIDEFGKTVFLTEEAAEAKLKELEGGNEKT